MIESTKAIVINAIKYGDTSLICTCYTSERGMKSYLLRGILKSKKGRLRPAYFQPLTQLKLTASHNNKGNLNSIRDAELNHFYNSIYNDIRKQSIALFLAEVLYAAIREEEKNEALYKYLEASFLWLDTHHDIANFHLLFLLNLTRFLGFYPEKQNSHAAAFDLNAGSFGEPKGRFCVTGDKLTQFKKLLGINFDVLHEVDFSVQNRQDILSILIQYFELHLSGFRAPKSLSVLKTVFN